jgi:hypothetical protein
MRIYIYLILTYIVISSCNDGKIIDNNSKFLSNSDTNTTESNSNVLNFNYKYPKNIFYIRDEEFKTEFYPIGFSPEALSILRVALAISV